jgi:hypothetical protein
MKRSTSPCSDDQLRVLLHGTDQDEDYRNAAGHLECCSRCQSRLAELAGSGDEWSEVRQSLTGDEMDRQIESEQAGRAWNTSVYRGRTVTWTDSLSSQLLAPPSHPEMLGRLGRYEVERVIGTGGMGVVFKAFDSDLNRPVAIKVLAPHLAGHGAARKRFSREARAAAAIVHEHVVAIHNVESDSEPPFLVMQYVAGESLQGRIDRVGPLTVIEILRIARQTAAGLAAAHEQGLVHRDVKPSNILLEEGVERTLLSDFGLARASDDASLTHSGHALGTPHYMSPEQARGDEVDCRSDLFSLGSVMYAMCTGRPPYRAETSYGVLRRITDSDPRPIREVNADIPQWLCALIDKLHAKAPDCRYDSAAEVAELLAHCLAHAQQPHAQPLPASLSDVADTLSRKAIVRRKLGRIGNAVRRQPKRTLVALFVILVLCAASIAYVRGKWNNARQVARPTAKMGEPEGATSAAALKFDPDLATNWEVENAEIRELNADVGKLTSRVDRLWGNLPSPNITGDTTESDLIDK